MAAFLIETHASSADLLPTNIAHSTSLRSQRFEFNHLPSELFIETLTSILSCGIDFQDHP